MKFTSAILLGLIAFSEITAIKLTDGPEDPPASDKGYDSEQSEYIKQRAANLDKMKEENAWQNGEKKIAGTKGPAPEQTDGT